MKAKRILVALCIGLSLCIGVAFITALSQHPVTAAISDGHPVLGSTELALSAGTASTSTALNLSGTASTSVPCYNMQLAVTISGTGSTNVLMGSTSSACTFPLYPTAATGSLAVTAGTAYSTYTTPAVPVIYNVGCTNLNQMWFTLTNSSSASAGTTTAKVEAIYTK